MHLFELPAIEVEVCEDDDEHGVERLRSRLSPEVPEKGTKTYDEVYDEAAGENIVDIEEPERAFVWVQLGKEEYVRYDEIRLDPLVRIRR